MFEDTDDIVKPFAESRTTISVHWS